MDLGKVEIKMIPLDMINPAPYNPRKDLQPEDTEYKKLERSIDEFGYVDPIVWNELTGNMVGGHQRYKILKNKGCTETDVSVVHLDTVKEKALNIALNKVSGEWDEEKLETLLKELESEIDLAITGYDINEINLITLSVDTNKFIDELLNDDFVSKNCEPDYFQVSFVFKKEFKEMVDNFISEEGKECIVENILKFIRGDMKCQGVEVR